MLPTTDLPNTAKDMMDDMLGNTGADDGSLTVPPESQINLDAAIEDETEPTSNGNTEMDGPKPNNAVEAIHQVQRSKGRPLGSKNNDGRKTERLPVRRSARREAILESQKKPSRSSTGTWSTRKSKAGKKEGSTPKRPKPSSLEKRRMTKRMFRGRMPGLRLRNWKGELIEAGAPIVEVFDDEVVDVEEFDGCFE